jgi:hypothetical protein
MYNTMCESIRWENMHRTIVHVRRNSVISFLFSRVKRCGFFFEEIVLMQVMKIQSIVVSFSI